mmetsp:Transcript_7911/g.19927  ORF Transcript_7911/g.19927 Transcript_7911/m.19927 type:complete len:193 (+) Transcript_7911:55-633(+)
MTGTPVLFCLCVLVVAASATVKCANPLTVDDVNVAKYFTGTWYQIAVSKTFMDTFEKKSAFCTQAQYALDEASGMVKVVNSGRESLDGPVDAAIGKAKRVEGGKFAVSFFGPFYGPYWITRLYGEEETGYEVAAVYSCSTYLFGLFGQESLWILSRTPTIPNLQTVLGDVEAYGVDVKGLNMQVTPQKGCPQ